MASVYKVRNSAGLYSVGGSDPWFTAKGKVWTTKAALTAHMSLVAKSPHKRSLYSGCVVEEIEVQYTVVSTRPAEDILLTKASEHLAKKVKMEEERKSRTEAEELRTLERLQVKYKGKV